MISADEFLGPVRRAGFDFFTGVPCSFLTPVINRVLGTDGLAYVAATSEGEAVAIASGAWLAGRGTVVMIQNSGLGNAVNPLTSLNFPFRIPTLLVVTWRGGPGLEDEPQHELMGAVTPDLLDLMRIPHRRFPTSAEAVGPVIEEAGAAMAESGLPFALIMEKGDVAAEGLDARASPARPAGERHDLSHGGSPPSRYEAIERLLGTIPEDAAVIATTGMTGRELFAIADKPRNLYQVGSMGGAAPMGLGVALNIEGPVVVLDGDGAALMKMGALATIGATGPDTLIHVVLDNGTYDSTGGQPTVSPSVDFAAVACACGYRHGFTCDRLDGLQRAVAAALETPGPHLVHVRVRPGSLAGVGRPTVTPADVARRFQGFLVEAGR